MVVIRGVASHREEDPRSVEAHLGIPHDALGHFQERRGLARSYIQQLQRATAPKAAVVDLARLEHRGRVVVVGEVLGPHYEQDRLPADQGVAQQRLATEPLGLPPEPSDLLGVARRLSPFPQAVEASASFLSIPHSRQCGVERVDNGQKPSQRLPGRPPEDVLPRCCFIDGSVEPHVIQRHMAPAACMLVHDPQDHRPTHCLWDRPPDLLHLLLIDPRSPC